MDHYHRKLAEMFGRQHAFAAGYSPLYSRLFGLVASWLSAKDAKTDPLVIWLLEAAQGRGTLEVTLLLAAGLHRQILSGEVSVDGLAQFYQTAGGDLRPEEPEFERILRDTMLARGDYLARFIRHTSVQTNETGRGLCWILPAMLTVWDRIHLVDLGASAGLNLVADLRSFRLVNKEREETFIDIGCGASPQFTTCCVNGSHLFDRITGSSIPVIESRTGCDAAPFSMATEEDEITLKSFIWGDQVERMERLCEGIAAYRLAQESASPVSVNRCELPKDLDRFLESYRPTNPSAPVVVYNTYMTTYLVDKGRTFVDKIGRWAQQQESPVLWVQWEPARDGRRPPVEGWIAWTVDLWQEENHRRWQLGWVHPHGGEAMFEGEWALAERSSAKIWE